MVRYATIAKTYTFDAAHQLPNHAGKCAQLHGHTYRVEVVLAGPIAPATGESDEGMVMDFADVGGVWKRLHAIVDHAFLNDVIPDAFQPTTAENIASWIANELSTVLPVQSVRLWETPTSWAQVTP